MDIKTLSSKIAQAEAGKSHVKIGDVREILRIIADLAVAEPEVLVALVRYANKRAAAIAATQLRPGSRYQRPRSSKRK
jgi:hypothetical protein